MNERVKLLREYLGFSQEDFGNRIGLVKSSISNIESGLRNVTDKHVKLICIEFNVNEKWLRTGEGEMFREVPEEDELAAYVSDLLDDDGTNPSYKLIKEIMRTYGRLDDKSKEVLNNFSMMLLDGLKQKEEG